MLALEEFGPALKRARKVQGLTQEQAAEKLGVSVRAYQGYERGEGYPPVEKALTIAEQMGVLIAPETAGDGGENPATSPPRRIEASEGGAVPVDRRDGPAFMWARLPNGSILSLHLTQMLRGPAYEVPVGSEFASSAFGAPSAQATPQPGGQGE